VDLKGFDEDTYQKLNSGKLAAILATLKTLHSLGLWFEIINLVVPTYTDNPDTIRRMCGWIVKELGPDRPLHFSRFQPQHKLAHLTPTPVETLVKARDAARAEGLRYVYIGNVPGLEGAGTTWCPNCKKAVVERDIFNWRVHFEPPFLSHILIITQYFLQYFFFTFLAQFFLRGFNYALIRLPCAHTKLLAHLIERTFGPAYIKKTIISAG